MCKKILAFSCILYIFLCFHACQIPEALEIRISPDFTTPVNSGDLNNLIEKNIKEAMAKNGNSNDMSLFRYSGYKLPNNKEVQTFIIRYNIMKDRPIDFFDDFDAVMNEFDGMDLDPKDMSTEISLESLTSFTNGIDPIPTDLNLESILEDAEDVINNSIAWHEVVPILLGLNQNLEEEEYILLFEDDENIRIDGLDNITFADNVTFSIELKVTLNDDYFINSSLSDVDFTIREIEIRQKDGESIWSDNHAVFNGANAIGDEITDMVYFNLSNRTLNSEFVIVLKDIHDATGSPTDVNLEISDGKIYAPTGAPLIRGIEGFVIEDDPLDPDDLTEVYIEADDIDLKFEGSEFIHAEVKEGTISFDITLPQDKSSGETWIFLKDFNGYDKDVIKEIYLKQDESEADLDGNIHPGLSERTGNTGNPNTEWFIPGADSLNGKHINNKPIQILDTSKITVPEGKISFMLKDPSKPIVQVLIMPNIEIESYSFVHINSNDVLNIPELDPIDLRGLTEGLHWLKFEKVGIELEFGRVDLDGYEIMITEPSVGINYKSDKPPNDRSEYKPMHKNETVSFTENCQAGLIHHDPDNVCSQCYHWDIDKNDRDYLQFEIDIRKIGGGSNVLEIKDLDATKDAIYFEVTAVNIFFKEYWTYASIDFSSKEEEMSDSFPGEEEDAIDLASYFKILQGFKFNDVDSYLYLEGPDRFFNIEPEITMLVRYGDDPGPVPYLFDDDNGHGTTKYPQKEMKRHILPNLDPNGDGKFSGKFIKGAPVRFDRVLDDMPNNLRIDYFLEFHDELVVTPEQIAGHTGETLDITLLIIVPLSLTADDDAKFEIPNMFKDKEDIFDRKKQGDASLLDNINRLYLNIHFSEDAFNGGELYMKRPDPIEEYGEELLKFPLSSRNLSIPITGKMLNTINLEHPFKIEEIGVRFNKGSLLDIPDNFKILEMDFNADLIYEQDF